MDKYRQSWNKTAKNKATYTLRGSFVYFGVLGFEGKLRFNDGFGLCELFGADADRTSSGSAVESFNQERSD
jgi:hypothetical protein